jgi:hypothetical protein
MKRVIYFLKNPANLVCTVILAVMLLDMQFNFLNKHVEPFIQEDIDKILSMIFTPLILGGAFIILVVWSTISYNNKDK